MSTWRQASGKYFKCNGILFKSGSPSSKPSIGTGDIGVVGVWQTPKRIETRGNSEGGSTTSHLNTNVTSWLCGAYSSSGTGELSNPYIVDTSVNKSGEVGFLPLWCHASDDGGGYAKAKDVTETKYAVSFFNRSNTSVKTIYRLPKANIYLPSFSNETGYTFKGFSRTAQSTISPSTTFSKGAIYPGGNVTSISSSEVSKDEILYIVYQATSVSVTFDRNGYGGANITHKFYYGDTANNYFWKTKDNLANWKTYWNVTNKALNKWSHPNKTSFYSPDSGVKDSWINGNAPSVTLTAQWANVYTITLDKQGGSNGTNSFYSVYGEKFASNKDSFVSGCKDLSSITVPYKQDNKFLGYYSAATGGTQYFNETGNYVNCNSTTFTKNTTLYAHWQSTVPEKPPVIEEPDPEAPKYKLEIKYYDHNNIYICSENFDTESTNIDVEKIGGKTSNWNSKWDRQKEDLLLIGWTTENSNSTVKFRNGTYITNDFIEENFKTPVEKDKGINTLILYPVYEAISVAVTTIFKINKNKSINAPNMAEVDDINNIRFYINGLVEAEEFIETDNFFGLFYDGSIHSAEFIEGGQ